MRRQPSIHITRDRLHQLITDFRNKEGTISDRSDIEELVNYLLKNGNRYQLTSRKELALSLKDAQKKKVKMAGRSNKADAQLFAKTYHLVRQANYHRGINLIKEGNSEWNQIKEVTKLATNFANDYNLPLKEGYTKYVQTAIDILPSFSLNRFNYRHEEICKSYEAKLEIELDPNENLTIKLYDYYLQVITSKTGLTNSYRNRPSKYVFFVKASKLCKDMQISYKVFIDAQFKSLEWIKGLPDPSQLVTPAAMDRIQKHLYAIKDDREEVINRNTNGESPEDIRKKWGINQ